MKRDLLSPALLLGLFLSTLAASGMCYWFLKASRDLRALQAQTAVINQKRAALQAFAIDVNEYARRNPAINPLLDQLNLRLRIPTNAPGMSANAPTNRP